MSSLTEAACKYLVLDAGPLLSLSPLRGLAETYVTVPQVLDELKDKRAREHFEQLALIAGVNVKVMSPDAAALAHGTRELILRREVLADASRHLSDTVREEDWRLRRALTS